MGGTPHRNGSGHHSRCGLDTNFLLAAALEGLRVAFLVRLLTVTRAAATRVPVALRLSFASASMLSFLSAAFSSFRFAFRKRMTLSWPSSSAQAIRVP